MDSNDATTVDATVETTPLAWSPAPISRELAMQFALILASGVPQIDAVGYMRPDLEGVARKKELSRWMRDPNVAAAVLKVEGKPWQAMSLEERIKFSIDKSYTEMAYFLYANNYCDLSGADRNKADVCRNALETKIAGMAGKMDALSNFWNDVQTGKILLQSGAPGRPAAPAKH